jgi:hypothetical protein
MELLMSLHPEQIKIFKSMSPETKLKFAFQLYASAKALKVATLKQYNPNMSEEKLARKIAEIFLYARS